MGLKDLVRKNIAKLGVTAAAEFYHVSAGTISNWSTGKTNPSIEAVELTLADLEGDQKTVLAYEEPAEEKITMWEGRKVAMLLPSYKTFNPDTHFTLMANYAKYGPEKIALVPPMKGTVIHEARNRLIDKAMKTEATSFLMVDDDMALPFGEAAYFNAQYGSKLSPVQAGYNAISRIMSHPTERGIIGALYFGRHAKGRAQCELGFRGQNESQALRAGKYQGLVPMTWVGTGFIRIERWVIEKLKAAIDAGEFPDCKPVSDQRWYGYFSPLRVGVGEDVSFGTRANKIGIQSYVDSSLQCLHNGDTWFGGHNTNG